MRAALVIWIGLQCMAEEPYKRDMGCGDATASDDLAACSFNQQGSIKFGGKNRVTGVFDISRFRKASAVQPLIIPCQYVSFGNRELSISAKKPSGQLISHRDAFSIYIGAGPLCDNKEVNPQEMGLATVCSVSDTEWGCDENNVVLKNYLSPKDMEEVCVCVIVECDNQKLACDLESLQIHFWDAWSFPSDPMDVLGVPFWNLLLYVAFTIELFAIAFMSGHAYFYWLHGVRKQSEDGTPSGRGHRTQHTVPDFVQ